MVCAFYAVCRVYNINITFQNILDVYKAYFNPFRAFVNLIEWGGVDKLWLGIDLTFIPNVGNDIDNE